MKTLIAMTFPSKDGAADVLHKLHKLQNE